MRKIDYALLAAVVLTLSGCGNGKDGSKQVKLPIRRKQITAEQVIVRVIRTDSSSRTASTNFIGKVEPSKSSVISCQFPGTLVNLNVKEGHYVSKGSVIGEVFAEQGVEIGDPTANGAVFATVKIPITDWAKVSRKIRRSGYEVEKAANEKEYLQSQLVLEIRKLWSDLTCAWDKMQVAAESVAVAEKTERQMNGQYDAGLVTVSDLLQAQTSLSSARNALTDSRIEYRKALTQYHSKTRCSN